MLAWRTAGIGASASLLDASAKSAYPRYRSLSRGSRAVASCPAADPHYGSRHRPSRVDLRPSLARSRRHQPRLPGVTSQGVTETKRAEAPPAYCKSGFPGGGSLFAASHPRMRSPSGEVVGAYARAANVGTGMMAKMRDDRWLDCQRRSPRRRRRRLLSLLRSGIVRRFLPPA
jgi:hypothetical protein